MLQRLACLIAQRGTDAAIQSSSALHRTAQLYAASITSNILAARSIASGGVCFGQSTISAIQQKNSPAPIRQNLNPNVAIVTSAFPPTAPTGPLTIQYPFPVDYFKDREALVFSMQAQTQGVHLLPGDVFNVPVRLDILHRVVRWLRAMWQQGTHKAKDRGEVKGGGRKPWPQKGTGRARHGSIRSPIWKGGGIAHGPTPRSHAHKLPMSIQLLGYKCALSAKANEGRLVLVDSLVPQRIVVDGVLTIKTQHTEAQLQALLKGVPHSNVLLVDCGEDASDGGAALRRGARNLPWVTIMPWQDITVYHLLKYSALVITCPAAVALAQRLQQPLPQHTLRPRRMLWWKQHKQSYEAELEQLLSAPQKNKA